MSVQKLARKQCAELLDHAAKIVKEVKRPTEGWLMTMRKALGISAPQLAKRVGVTKAAIYQAERNELAGAITINQLEKLAASMGGQLVYAIVSDRKIVDVIQSQAELKATTIVGRADAHMALEQQSLSSKHSQQEIKRLTAELIKNRPSNFWDLDDV